MAETLGFKFIQPKPVFSFSLSSIATCLQAVAFKLEDQHQAKDRFAIEYLSNIGMPAVKSAISSVPVNKES